MAKRTNTKAATDKKTAAKKKVDELLDDVLPKKETKSKAKVAEDKKNQEWLEGELERLGEENARLENELVKAKEDYAKLHADFQKLKETGGVTTVAGDEVTKKVEQMFRELENAHLGLNPERIVYTDTKVIAQLNNMMAKFPFLKPRKKQVTQ